MCEYVLTSRRGPSRNTPVEQRGTKRQASRFSGIRLNVRDQENVALIIRAGLAQSISDAIRYGLERGARIAKRMLK